MNDTRAPSPDSTPAAPTDGTPAWSTAEIGIVAGVLVAHLVLAWLIREPGITYRNDDALYLLLSRSLRQLQYLNAFLVEPSSHTQYPPGYPLLLALLSLLAGERLDVFLAVGTLCSAMGLGLLYSLVRRHTTPWVALAVLVPVAVNDQMLRLAGSLLAESVFLGLTMLSLWLMDREVGRPRMLAMAVAAAIAATMMRSVGVALLAALVAHLLLSRRLRDAVRVVVASGATVGLWLLHTYLVPVAAHLPGRSYIRAANNIPGESLLTHVWIMAYRYRVRDLPEVFPIPGLTTVEGRYFWANALTALCLVGLFLMWRRWRPATLLLMAYTAILLVWPIRSSRFLYGITPLIILAVMLAVERVTRGKRRVQGIALAGCSVVLAAGGGLGWVADWRALAACDRSRALDRPGCFTEDARTLYVAARALGQLDLPPGGALAVHDPMVAYYSGRQTANVTSALQGDSAAFLTDLQARGLRYMVFGRTRGSELRTLAPEVARWCRRLELVIWVPPRAQVYRVRNPEEPDDAGASCYSITAYLADSAKVPPQRK